MRSLAIAALLVLSASSAFAAVEIEVTKVAFDVRIESVKALGPASNGYLEVVANAEASNACMVPPADKIAVYQKNVNGGTAYTVVQMSDDRVCPAVFSPTPFTLRFKLLQGSTLNGLAIGEEGNPRGFVCQPGWINCMPIVSPDRAKYCTAEYETWAIKNCGGRPQIAH